MILLDGLVWTVVLQFDAEGHRINRQFLESPYLEPATLVECESGLHVSECDGCNSWREDVRGDYVSICRKPSAACCRQFSEACVVDMVAAELCRACRGRP